MKINDCIFVYQSLIGLDEIGKRCCMIKSNGQPNIRLTILVTLHLFFFFQ